MPAMPNLFTRRFVTFGERNAGSVGPKWIFFSISMLAKQQIKNY